jgi:hypothetical protein
MIQTFTSSDVIRYVYEETTEFENELVEDALMADPDLLLFYLDALELKNEMNKISREPSDRTIDNILAYSRSYPNSQPVFA